MPILVLARLGSKLASLALAMNLAASGAGSAQPAPPAVCLCQCDAGTAGLKEAIYPATASCRAHEGQTCNFEGPDHTVRSGTLRACHPDQRPRDAAAPLGPHSAGVLMRPDRPRPDPPPGPEPEPEPAPR